jgi:hypothetical protein
LGIDVTDYVTWTEHYQYKVAQYMLDEKPTVFGYSTVSEIQNRYVEALAIEDDGIVGSRRRK